MKLEMKYESLKNGMVSDISDKFNQKVKRGRPRLENPRPVKAQLQNMRSETTVSLQVDKTAHESTQGI